MARIETEAADRSRAARLGEKRVLLFAPYFLPRRRVGSMRPFRFAIHLAEFGWKPAVLTIAAPGQQLTAKERTLLRGVEIVEITSPFDRTTKSESQLGRTASAAKPPSTRLLDAFDRQFPIDTWLLLFLARYRELLRIARAVNPDVLWATGDPWSSLVIGARLAARLQIPYFPDFRDPWTLSDLRADAQAAMSRAVDRFFERRVLERADIVVFQTRRVEQLYQRHYADVGFASRTIPNSFDPAVFEDRIDFKTASARAVSAGDGLMIGFFGRFRRMSPATLIVDVLSALRRKSAAAAPSIEVHSFGDLSAEDAAYASERGVAANFQTRQAVPLENALSVLRSFDILLLSTEESRKEIIPAKLFEYLAAGRPILSLARNPDVEDILRKTGTGVQINDPVRAADLLEACLSARRAGEPMPIPFNPDPDEIARYEASRTTGDLAALFDKMIAPERR